MICIFIRLSLDIKMDYLMRSSFKTHKFLNHNANNDLAMSARNSTAASTRVVQFKTLDGQTQQILREAVEARNFAYCPYSKFQVGATLLCEDGTIYRGCNIENASFTVGICAERAALAKAISEGNMKFKAVAVIAYQEKSFTTPCGACRQFMSEFGNIDIYVAKPELDTVLVTDLNQLLPHQFQHSSDYTF